MEAIHCVLTPETTAIDMYCGEVVIRAQLMLTQPSLARLAARLPAAPQLVSAKFGEHTVMPLRA